MPPNPPGSSADEVNTFQLRGKVDLAVERLASLGGLAVMLAGVFGLIAIRSLFGVEPIAIAVQIAAAALMLAARLTLGVRSFHAAANPTEGGIVTKGPYA